jgi:hypothetical protein
LVAALAVRDLEMAFRGNERRSDTDSEEALPIPCGIFLERHGAAVFKFTVFNIS